MSVSPEQPDDAPRLRIGELSRRTGVRADTLRAWERRYGLLRPQRTDGGFRLYGREDERRVQAMKALIESGVSAAEAAKLAPEASPVPAAAEPGRVPPELEAGRLRAALERFDEAGAHSILDAALTRLTLDAVADRLILPAMREIGERWENGEISIAQEHFATGVLRGRMLALGRNWGAGVGPRALLACPPGEQHDLGLVAFGLVLRDRGWRVTYLGPDTPIETIAGAAADLDPVVVVLAVLDAERLEAVGEQVSELASEQRVLVGGEGADADLVRRLGAEPLDPDPVRAALELSWSPGG
jgi:DNA-binding transcriptional MerR regulator/methylmalonyl-CoA mutase cobalamin-binding subunit